MFRLLLGLVAVAAPVPAIPIDAVGNPLTRVPRSHLTAQKRIVGGRVVGIFLHPYQVSVRCKLDDNDSVYQQVCSGSIISPTMIVTAAHCVNGRKGKKFHIVAGTSLLQGSDGVIVPLKEFIMHERYNPNTDDNDIALLILAMPLPLNNLTIAAIELMEEVVRVGATATVSGWGSNVTKGAQADVLHEVRVPIISNEACNHDYMPMWLITDGMMCAGLQGVGGKDACDGDSGGPLVVDGRLAGIVSWGIACAHPKYLGVYTRISYYYPWLMENIAKHL